MTPKKDSEFLTNSAIETQKTQKFGVNSEILTPLEPLEHTIQALFAFSSGWMEIYEMEWADIYPSPN